MGHQCIAQYFGANIIRASHLMHGKNSLIYHNGDGLFQNIPSPFSATRYHSLIVDPETLPSCFRAHCLDRTGRPADYYGVETYPLADPKCTVPPRSLAD